MNDERMIAVSSDLIERAVSLLDLLPESGTIIELRAALATQPAVLKLPDRKRTDHLPTEYKTMTPTRASIESYNRALDDVAALNTVRGADHA